MSEDWEKTFHEPANAAKVTWLGVHTNVRSDTVRARSVLEEHHPIKLRTSRSGDRG